VQCNRETTQCTMRPAPPGPAEGDVISMAEPKPEALLRYLMSKSGCSCFASPAATDWTRVGISGATARNMVVKDLVAHDRKTMRLVLTARGAKP
jgi:hypothetical protein